MVAPNAIQNITPQPLAIVGGNQFGRYSKISVEETFNMLISDDALVPYAGYKNVLTKDPDSVGRGLYSSSRGNLMVAVWGDQVFRINPDLTANFIGNVATSSGDIFISENNNAEIALTDGVNVYVYNWLTFTYLTSIGGIDFTVPFSSPGYISFQNGRLIIADNGTQNWYLSGFNDATDWPATSNFVGALQSKPDTIQAAVPTPGGGNNLVLFGNNVTEQWQDVGATLFPYQRSSSFNVDFGTLNASSIATLDNYVVWLAGNEQSGATLMYYSGNKSQSISTDGINFKLAGLTNPSNCTGFLFRQDGHILYQFTFPDDNLSYVYDFNTQKFFTVTDEDMNYHIARTVVFFNNKYYFVSLRGGNLYEFGTQYTDADYGFDDIRQIPRIRVTPPFRVVDQRYFIIKSLGFTIENGLPNDIMVISNLADSGDDITTEGGVAITTENDVYIVTESYEDSTYSYSIASESVDLSISRDGGATFGGSLRLNMNPVGKRKSRFIFQRLGQANDATFQIRFNGFGRFVVFDGQVEIYQ